MLPTTKTPPKTGYKDLTVLIYGASKIGKSTFCSKADEALFLATEPGLNSLETYQIPIDSWARLKQVAEEIKSGTHKFKTVVLDTVDNAYDLCRKFVCDENKVKHESEGSYGKIYQLIRDEFRRMLTELASFRNLPHPVGFFLISHSQEKELDTRTGKQTKTMPKLPDQVREVVLGMVDLVLYCDVDKSTTEEGKISYRRVMRTKPNTYYEAGDRTGKLPECIDLDFAAFAKCFNGTNGTK
jgi:hypothetical protein